MIGFPKPEKLNRPKINFMNNGSYPNVQRGTYLCSKGDVYFRSKWEANYALVLDFMVKQGEIKSWEYESRTFVFNEVDFGIRRYLPDFEILNNDGSTEFHEIKGYFDKASKTKIKRMAKYYPDVKLKVIEKDEYNAYKKQLGKVLHFY
jgi:hypothetical protein